LSEQHERRPLTHPVEDPSRGSREASPAPAEPGPAAQRSKGELEREALAEAIRERDEYLDALQEAWTEAAQAIYAQASAEGRTASGSSHESAAAGDDEVIEDADYEVVDDEAKTT